MELLEEIQQILIAQLAIKPELVKPESKFSDDLSLDSLDAVDVMLAVEEKFDIDVSDEEASAVSTVAEMVSLVERKLQGKSTPAP